MIQEKSDIQIPWICVFVISLLIGLVFSKWPDKVRRYDMRMALFIKNPKTHTALIQAIGYFLLMLAFIAMMGSIVTFFQ